MDRVAEWLFGPTGQKEKKTPDAAAPVPSRKPSTASKKKSASDEDEEEILRPILK